LTDLLYTGVSSPMHAVMRPPSSHTKGLRRALTGVGAQLLVGCAWAASASIAAGCSSDNAGPGAPATSVIAPSSSPSAPPTVPEGPDLTGLDCLPENPVPSEGRLLTRLQYNNSARDVFKGLVAADFSAGFPAENEVVGFGTNAQFHRATPWLTEAQMMAADAVATAVLGRLAELLPCSVDVADEACAQYFIQEYGERAFRRPLTESEIAPLLDVYRSGKSERDFAAGISWVVQALLQSPQFLYRFDLSKDTPLQVAGAYQLSDTEMASRLSYFFWNSIPDEELRARAAAGELRTKEQIESQARRLLADPKTEATLLDFTRQWLGGYKFASLVRVAPDVSEQAYNQDWQQSLQTFIDHALLGPNGGMDALFNSPTVYLNQRLAGLYGVPVPSTAGENEFFSVELPGERFGLLTQPGLMALLAHADQSAPIQRGVFIRTKLLCQPPPDPPPSVDPTPPDPDPGATTRERFAQHTAEEGCAGCHRLIDGLGLPLEGFDNLGRVRTTENGLNLDLSGEVFATRDTSIVGTFNGPSELAKRLAASSQVESCLVTQLYRYGSGRVEATEDLCSLAQAGHTFHAAGGNFGEMMVAMAVSDAFRYRTETAVGEQEVQP
jgi:Protein of unknown function (DUF1592)/Protein of unknown function (DUF1588)/Protein of unknown function (DUF1595)/Protein of unknown function (DUF1585)/Protein of unknown function (DUF1587)